MDPMGTRLGRLIKYYEIKLASEIIIWMFPKIVVPQNGWLLKWMIWGYHYFRKLSYKSSLAFSFWFQKNQPNPCLLKPKKHDTVKNRDSPNPVSFGDTKIRREAELRVFPSGENVGDERRSSARKSPKFGTFGDLDPVSQRNEDGYFFWGKTYS